MRNLLILLTIPCFLILKSCNPESTDEFVKNPVEYVNPFIGTAGYGHTFPGAALPFGMVQLSPSTGAIRDKGYSYTSVPHGRDSKTIIGFTHTNLSGTGIGHIAKYANISLMPTVGELIVVPGSEDDPEGGYRSLFSHESEKASPGYYKVELKDYNVKAELTVTRRSGIHRYTFPKTDQANIIIDITRERLWEELNEDAYIEIAGNNSIIGYTKVKGHHSGKPLTWYFYAEFSKPFESFGTFSNSNVVKNQKSARGSKGVGAYLTYSTAEDEELIVKVGISFTSIDGAKNNLRSEAEEWDFDEIKLQAKEIWNDNLKKIQISGGTVINKTKFYTSLYRTLLFPRTFSDHDGAWYSHFNDSIIFEDQFDYYVDFSLWDTYRTTHPLFTIIEPERQTDMIKTFLTMYEQGGRIPGQVTYRNFYSPIMIGDHGSTTIIDSYMKGIRGFDVKMAYEGMIKNAFEPGLPDRSRPGLVEYTDLGYVPAESIRESVSKTLEYTHTDWALAQMSKKLGKEKDYKLLMDRAGNYRNLYHEESGFYRPRYSDGSWLPECEYGESPEIINFGTNTYYSCWNRWWIGVAPHRHYTEGNAWQNLFYPQHDIEGVINLMGGRENFIKRLDGLFYASSANEGPWYVGVTGAIGQYVHGNQPSHHFAYLYNYAGAPYKTQERTRGIMETLYRADEWGLPGNEDMGEMSAWYVFSALGFYPVTPGQPVYSITSPLFEKAVINLGDFYSGETFTIIAEEASGDNKYIKSAFLNGKALERPWITHEEITNGGVLRFKMSSEPGSWGSEENSAPPSMSRTVKEK